MAEKKIFGKDSFYLEKNTKRDKYAKKITSISLFTIDKFDEFTDCSYVNASYKSIRLYITVHRWTVIHWPDYDSPL